MLVLNRRRRRCRRRSGGSLVSCTLVSPCALFAPPGFLSHHCPSGPSGPSALQTGPALGHGAPTEEKEVVTGPSAVIPGSNTGVVCEDVSVLVLEPHSPPCSLLVTHRWFLCCDI